MEETLIQKFIEQLKEAKAKESCASLSIEDGFDRAIEIAESMLEKEKEVMCQFAYKFETRNNLRSAEQYYNETFNTKEK